MKTGGWENYARGGGKKNRKVVRCAALQKENIEKTVLPAKKKTKRGTEEIRIALG